MEVANFYDISIYIDLDYEKYGYVRLNENDFKSKIKIYLNEHNEIKPGDIIFVGSTYDTRQEYGFGIVIENNNFILDNYGPSLPIRYRNKIPKNISYSSILNRMNNDEDLNTLWYGEDMDSYNEVVELYKEKNIY